MSDEPSVSSRKSPKMNVPVDLRIVVIVLLVAIIAMLALWRPWTARIAAGTRTISVTGEATIKATPDEYVFYPSYEFKNADKTAALNALTAKQTEIVAALKKLGVADSMIKADSNGYNQNYYFDETDKTYDYTLTLTVTVDSSDLSQKVQDYLVSTSPTGSVSPSATFSTTKKKQLESQGRDQASKDARSKADQSASNLGFKVGAVKSVTDGGNSTGGMTPYAVSSTMSADLAGGTAAAVTPSLGVQSGQNEFDYSVTVVYYVK